MKNLKFLVAPDSFKGSLTAIEVCNAIETGLKKVFPEAEIVKVPMADGGEGTITSLVDATGGSMINKIVTGPLGDEVNGYFGILGDGKTAVIEMAAASGLPLVPRNKRNPLLAHTFGTGELIKAALDAGCRKIIIGIGGSATNDAGTGMAEALGVKFFNHSYRPLERGGKNLSKLAKIDITGMDSRVWESEILVACDVTNPLTGPKGASAVYGPQKGATPEMVAELDAALSNFAKRVREDLGKEVDNIEGAGAAGGLGAGLLAFTPAKLMPGVDIVVENTKLREKMIGAALVLTGEGRTDFQTLYGKTIMGVANCAKSLNVPVAILSGSYTEDAKGLYAHGIDAMFSIVKGPCSIEDAIKQSKNNLTDSSEGIARLFKIGMKTNLKD